MNKRSLVHMRLLRVYKIAGKRALIECFRQNILPSYTLYICLTKID